MNFSLKHTVLRSGRIIGDVTMIRVLRSGSIQPTLPFFRRRNVFLTPFAQVYEDVSATFVDLPPPPSAPVAESPQWIRLAPRRRSMKPNRNTWNTHIFHLLDLVEESMRPTPPPTPPPPTPPPTPPPKTPTLEELWLEQQRWYC